jgi:hypothetical protein
MKSCKYIVNVKRLTTSVNMPEFEMKKNPETGEVERIPTGRFYTEVPSKAEQAQLTQGRSKQVPYEFLLKTVQDGKEVKTDYDSLPIGGASAGALSVLPKSPPLKKALPQFYVEV